MVENARMIASIRPAIPLIADADTGFGGPAMVDRTVKAYERAGVAALHIEDQSMSSTLPLIFLVFCFCRCDMLLLLVLLVLLYLYFCFSFRFLLLKSRYQKRMHNSPTQPRRYVLTASQLLGPG